MISTDLDLYHPVEMTTEQAIAQAVVSGKTSHGL